MSQELIIKYAPLESVFKQQFRTPFEEEHRKKLIVHCCYHKVGTAWFIRVLRNVSRYYGLNFQCCDQRFFKRNTDVFMEYMSRINLDELPDCVGSHMIRDPRDVVISGYFYHLWTNEEWAHIPWKSLNNQTYQETLKSLDENNGLLFEMQGKSKEVINEMSRWNYHNPDFFEFKYEDIIQNEQDVFYNIFRHYNFRESAIQNCLKITEKFSFKNKAKRKVGIVKSNNHLRSGRLQQWKEHFNDEHKQQFKQLFGNILIKLGYETDNDW